MDSGKFLAALLAVTSFCVQSLVIEKQLSSCAVVTDQGTVDFSKLAGTEGNPGFPGIASVASATATYDWNPCADFTEQQCQSVAICKVDTDCDGARKLSRQVSTRRRPLDTCYQGIGSQASSTFSIQNDVLELQVADPVYLITAHILIVCNTSVSVDSVQCIDDYLDPINPTFQLSGPSVCFQQPSSGTSLSVGTVLCITFIVSAVAYLIAGILYMKMRVKAQGAEVIPNASFWRSIPSNVKIGFLYVKSGFRPNSLSYENI